MPPATVETILEDPQWPDEFPFPSEAFQRFDEGDDSLFYDSPRFVTHIDDNAIASLTSFYSHRAFPPSGSKDVALLDLCSSWISHYPAGYQATRVVGLGMNEAELARNSQLTEFVVQDLNDNPIMSSFADNSFDVITNAVSVDYLTKPLDVFREMHRILKPGGLAVMSFSNRCFPTKAIALWTGTDDVFHCLIVGSYFHYSVKDGWTAPKAEDITGMGGKKVGGAPPFMGGNNATDPLFVVYARKKEE